MRSTDRPRAARGTVWGRVGLVLLAVLVSVTVGVTTATARGAFGPHEARYDVTTDATLTADLGPLGTVQVRSPLPLRLGVRATVGEIPQGVTGLDPSATLQALAQDVNQYVAFFAGISASLHAVEVALVEDAVRRSALVLAALVGCWWLGRVLLGGTRRAELVVQLARHRRAVAAGAVALLVGGAVLTGSVAAAPRPGAAAAPVSAVFDGTPLQGARITGRLGGIVDTYSAQILAAYRANDEFYDRADAAVRTAWVGYQREHGTATTSAASVTVLMVSDLHCDIGMARVIGTLTRLSGARVVVDGGDTTISGTSVEDTCATTVARAVPSGVRLVAVVGNHDSQVTSRAYAKAGATMLSGTEVTVDGIRFFGDADPDRTLFGAGTTAGTQSEEGAGQRVADAVCADGRVDVLLIHNPRVARDALDRGCVPAVLAGHLHTRIDPVQVGGGIRYVSSSTAGARAGQLTIGPLKGTAELTVLRFDPGTHRFVSWQIVQVHTDATATVLDPQPWPQVAAVAPTPAPEPSGGD